MVLISGTLVSSFVALAVAIPMGTDHRHLPFRVRRLKVREMAKPILELLGGIPTIVFGYFALLVVTPILQVIFPNCPASRCSPPAWSWAS
jgi:phosphate transport system permease protein